MCIRRNDDMLKSLVAEYAKETRPHPYPKDFETKLKARDWNVFTSHLISYYHQCVEKENLIIFFYPLDKGIDIIPLLFQAMGYQAPHIPKGKKLKIKPSLPGETLPFYLKTIVRLPL